MASNPQDKRTSWGSSDNESVGRTAKAYRAGKGLVPPKKAIGNGSSKLGAMRFLRDLFKDEDDD